MRFLRIYRRVLTELAADRRLAWLLAAGNVLVAGLQFLDPVLFGRVVQLLARSDRLAASAVWAQAVPLLALWMAVGAATILASMATALHADRMAHRNRLRAMTHYFNHVITLPLAYHGQTQSGRLLKTMLSGADSLFGTWLLFFREQCSVMVAVVVLLPLTVLMNWRLGLCLIVLTAVFGLLALFVIRRTEDGQRRAQQHQAALGGAAHDALANVMVVQSFARMQAEAARLQALVAQVIAHQFPVLTWWAVVHVLTRTASTAAVIAIVVIGTLLHLRGAASVGEIVAFMGLASLLIGRLEAAMQFASNLFTQMPVLEDFFDGMAARSGVPERPGAPALTLRRGEVVFEHVRFGYPNGPTVLDDISFTARPGKVVALVGPTGSGKSTAMALLQRLWDPQEGSVRIDGQDLRDVTLDSLRGAIGVVFQDSLLFSRSIADNLRVGRPGATQAELEQACRLADAHEFIIRQAQGYETMVGERGVTLSGGQRQRLAIARALLKDPPILVLDEATSALDAATEARVSLAMAALMRGRTTIVIAHRLSTVRDADEILVFAGGRIVERGGFAELLARGGCFAELVATQLTGVGVGAAGGAALAA